jgi:tRNA modification GTPase
MDKSVVSPEPTIVAIVTAAGIGGVGIIRISGVNSFAIAKTITSLKVIEPKAFKYVSILNNNSQLLDRGLLLAFKAPASFTGEDVIELQMHGGPVLLQSVLNVILKHGARLAEPGEFTKRAFLNNKLDLTQAEAVADIISASTESAVLNAANSLSGKFSFKINNLLKKLIDIRLYIEACLDFPEEDIDFIEKGQIKKKLASINLEIKEITGVAKKGLIIQDGFQVSIVGKPNVGKSTLINLLSQDDLAIVSNTPGTTRDPVRAFININGIPVKIIDTAGIHETSNEIERAGIEKTYSLIKASNLLVIIIEDVKEIDDYIESSFFNTNLNIIWVLNKIDLINTSPSVSHYEKNSLVYISAKLNLGIDLLENEIASFFSLLKHDSNEQLFSARQRHLQSLNKVASNLKDATNNLSNPELLAEDLHVAQKHLSSITGEFSSDDLLGEIFSRFCIGK